MHDYDFADVYAYRVWLPMIVIALRHTGKLIFPVLILIIVVIRHISEKLFHLLRSVLLTRGLSACLSVF